MISLRHKILKPSSALLISAILVGHALAADYFVTDLGTLGGAMSAAFAINDAGVVVGESAVTAGDRTLAFVWDGQMTALSGLPDLTQSVAFGINAAGDIAGAAYNLGDLHQHAVTWSASQPTGLGAFLARAINNGGTVAGSTVVDLGGMNYVRRAGYYAGGVLTTLGTLGGETSEAFALSNTGWIVGSSTTGVNTPPHAFAWIAGAMHDLGTLGGDRSVAYGANDNGEVVGIARNAAGVMHAFRYQVNAAGTVTLRTDLGELGGSYSAAYGINAAGAIVGTSDDKAFLWSNGTLTDLNTRILPNSGWLLSRATAINAGGQIVGQGRHHGELRAFLLTPVRPGDVNCDGVVDFGDIDAFVAALSGTFAGPCSQANADANGDGAIDFGDIDPFVALLSAP